MKLVFCLPFCPSIHSSWTLRFRRLRRVHRPIRRHRASSTAAAVPLRRTTPSTPARFLPPTISFALLWMIEIGSIWWLAASSEAPWIQKSGPSHSNPSFFSCDSWWYWWRRWHRVANCWNRCEICLGGELKCLIELLQLMLFCAPFEDLAWLIFFLCCWYRSRDFSSAPSVFRRRRWKWGSISWFEANSGALRIKNGFLAVEIVDSVAIFGDNSDRLDIVCPALFFSSIEVWNRVGFGTGSEFGVASIVVLCIFWSSARLIFVCRRWYMVEVVLRFFQGTFTISRRWSWKWGSISWFVAGFYELKIGFFSLKTLIRLWFLVIIVIG